MPKPAYSLSHRSAHRPHGADDGARGTRELDQGARGIGGGDAGLTMKRSDEATTLAAGWAGWYANDPDLTDRRVLDLLDRLQTALAGRYAIEREIGHGGMAVVYLARDLGTTGTVALKVLQPQFAEVLGAERFLREIQVAARLHHPHLLPLYDSGEADGFLYYVMPVHRGRLAARPARPREGGFRSARRSGSPARWPTRWTTPTARASSTATSSPRTSCSRRATRIVADFGIARAVSAAADERASPRPAWLVGTPAYMSPEQASGERASTAGATSTALGCVLYEMLAGQPPFTAARRSRIIAQRLTGPRPTSARPGSSVPPPSRIWWPARWRSSRTTDSRPPPSWRARWRTRRRTRHGRRRRRPRPRRLVTPRVTAVAVLPFVNMSADPENEFFSDGMTEELINALTRVEGLRVASRTSAFAFKGRDVDVREAGRSLQRTGSAR